MKKIFLVANGSFTLSNFRKEFIQELGHRGYEVHCAFPGNEEIEGVHCHHISLSRKGLNPFEDLKLFFELFKLFIKHRPWAVYNYTIKPVIYSSIAASLAGVTNIFSNITGLGYVFTGKSLKQSFIKIIVCLQYQLALACNKKVFFQNPDDRKLFIDLDLVHIKDTKLINGSGINLDTFRPVEKTMEGFTFLLIARLLRDKGISEYVEAAKNLKKEYPKTKFQIIGDYDSNPAAYSKEEVENWVKQDIIEYLGPQSDVRPYIAQASVFVLPSYREGTPRAVLESMSMAKPIITTDVPGCRETTVHGFNGLLVKDRDSKDLEKAMRTVLTNPELLEKFSKNSLQRAIEKYDVHKVNESILDELC